MSRQRALARKQPLRVARDRLRAQISLLSQRPCPDFMPLYDANPYECICGHTLSAHRGGQGVTSWD